MATNRNALGGLLITCAGGALLAFSAYQFVASHAYANDIYQELCDFNGCRSLEAVTREGAVGTGIFGALVTASGLFFFIYGMKQTHQPVA